MFKLSQKTYVIAALILLAAVGLVWLVMRLSTATIVVNTQPDNSVWVKQGDSRDFHELGTGRAVFKTRSTGPVVVEVRRQLAISQRSVQPIRRQTISIEMDAKDLVTPSRVADGPLTSLFVGDQLAYGINPVTGALSAKPLAKNVPTPVLPNLPFLKDLVWLGSETNYFFTTLGRGVGRVKDNRVDERTLPFVSLAASPSLDRFALLAGDGVYLAKSVDLAQATKIAPNIENSAPAIFADQNYIYHSSLIYKPSANEDDEPVGDYLLIAIFDYSGQKLAEHRLPLATQPSKILSLGKEQVIVLSDAGLVLLDKTNGKTQTDFFALGEVDDLIARGDELLLLGSEGLWQYQPSNQTYYKLAAYPEGEEYVKRSLSLFDNSAYFSTSVSREVLLGQGTSAARSSLYRVGF